MLVAQNKVGGRGMVTLITLLSLIGFITILPKYLKFRSSKYKSTNGNTFLRTLFDKGNYGEYLTFLYLEKINGHQRLMTNLYIPKSDGSTTEIDLIMVSETGIYVFESKNYSGWIFGDEQNKTWVQTLQNKQKNRFFNPIWQNKAHINALKLVVGISDLHYYKSYIIFSERSTLKKINVATPEVKIIKRNKLVQAIKEDMSRSKKLFTPQEVDQIYSKLQKYTLVADNIKKAHVHHIQMKK